MFNRKLKQRVERLENQISLFFSCLEEKGKKIYDKAPMYKIVKTENGFNVLKKLEFLDAIDYSRDIVSYKFIATDYTFSYKLIATDYTSFDLARDYVLKLCGVEYEQSDIETN